VGLSAPSPPSYHMMTLREIPKGSLHLEKCPKVRYTLREIPKGSLHSEKYPKVRFKNKYKWTLQKLGISNYQHCRRL
jgi:hypothetical protein